jgi:hypothetical protein
MAMSPLWRRVSRNFGISAPRMAVRTHLPWWGRGALVLTLIALITGMWWLGFDFGQILGLTVHDISRHSPRDGSDAGPNQNAASKVTVPASDNRSNTGAQKSSPASANGRPFAGCGSTAGGQKTAGDENNVDLLHVFSPWFFSG